MGFNIPTLLRRRIGNFPLGIPRGASTVLGFEKNAYLANNRRYAIANIPGATYSGGVNGIYGPAPRVEPSVGLLVEAAATRFSLYPRTETGWLPDNGAVIEVLSTTADGFVRRRVTSGGFSFSRTATVITQSLTSGTVVFVRARYETGTSGRARVVFRNTGAGTESNVAGVVGALVATNATAGAVSNVVNTNLGGGVFEVSYEITLNANGTNYTLGVGPDTSDNTLNVIFHGAQSATGAPGWIFATPNSATTRTADSIQYATASLGLADDASFTRVFDDGTTDTLTAVSGTLTVPANTKPIARIYSL